MVSVIGQVTQIAVLSSLIVTLQVLSSVVVAAEMAKEALEKVEERLNCSICLDTYTDPKLLQCFHVFCRQCLVPLVVRNQQGRLGLTCPSCRQVTNTQFSAMLYS